MFYALGALDPEFYKDENSSTPFSELTESQKQERTRVQKIANEIHFGSVQADPVSLSKLH